MAARRVTTMTMTAATPAPASDSVAAATTTPTTTPASTMATARDTDLALRVCRHIDGNLDGAITLDGLAAAAGMSPFHLQRTFKRVLGISPRQYADARR